MKKNIWALVLCLVLLVTMLSCERRPTLYPIPNKKTKSGEQQPTAWPGITNDSGVIVENKTARNLLVVLDISGSMAESRCSAGKSKLIAMQKALLAFADAVNPDDNLGLIAYSHNSTLHVPLAPAKVNKPLFVQKVMSLEAGGGTAMSLAVDQAYEELTRQGQAQLGYGQYFLVMATDGEASVGYDPQRHIEVIISNTPIIVYTIGFCIGKNHSLNMPGRTIYKDANSPEELKDGLQGVLAESESFDPTDFQQ